MKRSIVIESIRVAVVALFISIGTANAQSAWPVSKGVNLVANKDLSSPELEASHIKGKSMAYPAVVTSKGVSRVAMNIPDNDTHEGNVASKGTPSWVVSKGVARISAREKSEETAIPSERKEIPLEHKETKRG